MSKYFLLMILLTDYAPPTIEKVYLGSYEMCMEEMTEMEEWLEGDAKDYISEYRLVCVPQ